MPPQIRILETPDEMAEVEELQRIVWPGSETDIVPAHLLLTVAHNGGLVLGAYLDDRLVGIVFGFPGLYDVPDGPRPKHCSHQMGVHPDCRDSGIGFALKRAQWQLVRKQGLDRITWTYDPLLSRNANLNISRLGAVCNTYLREVYGKMRDGLNVGLPSDRFQVDWWINTSRVERRIGRDARPELTLRDFAEAQTPFLYNTSFSPGGFVAPPESFQAPESPLVLAEIPSDFLKLKTADFGLARQWRMFSRELFEFCFSHHYIVTDFVFDHSSGQPRSYYVLSNGESQLSDFTVRK